MRVTINDKQRGILIRHGRFVSLLLPGKHRVTKLMGYRVELMEAEGAVKSSVPLHVLLRDEEFSRSILHLKKKPEHVMVMCRHGVPIYAPDISDGAWWNMDGSLTLTYLPCSDPEVPAETVRLYHGVLQWKRFTVQEGEAGYLYYDGKFQRKLTPGAYHFWNGPVQMEVRCISLRQQQLEINGQEILTEDRIPVRLNLAVQYEVTAPDLVAERFENHQGQIYTLVQLAVRKQVAGSTLDALLNERETIANALCEAIGQQAAALGVTFLSAGVKDIILPGDIREIINRVLIAEKTAQANVIARREEVASTRSLLNTARLMEENETLYKLKELEYLERICDKVGNISVSGGDLLGQLKELLSTRKKV